MADLNRTPDTPAPGKGPGVDSPSPAPPAAEKLAASAVATLDKEVPPQAKVPDLPDLGAEKGSEGPSNEAPAAAKPDAPAPEARSINELAKEPAARAALEAALTNGSIRYDSLKTAVKQGLETGDFQFKSAGQERVVKEIIADAIKPEGAAPAQEKAAAGPAGAAPEATAPAPAKGPAIERAIADLETKLPGGLDKRVADALTASPEVMAAKNPPFTRGGELLTAKPSVGDSLRYANAMAIKTENFEPASVVADFQTAMSRTNKGSLYDLANDQGVKLYPKPESSTPSNGRDVNAAVAPESVYGRAITAAKEKGVELPAPADPEKGYTLGEARQMNADKLLDLDSVARARQTPAPAPAKEMAGPEDRKLVLDAVSAGNAGKPGLAKEDFMALSNPGKNEVRGLVKSLEAPGADITSLVVTAALAKEMKAQLEKKASGTPE